MLFNLQEFHFTNDNKITQRGQSFYVTSKKVQGKNWKAMPYFPDANKMNIDGIVLYEKIEVSS